MITLIILEKGFRLLYKALREAIVPTNLDTKVWRYVDLPKFLDIIERRSLFFSSAAKFKDHYEGAYTKPVEDEIKKAYDMMLSSLKPSDPPVMPYEVQKNYIERVKDIVFVNCWQESEHDIPWMWKEYADPKFGVAIQSTFRKLMDSFSGTTESICISKVDYVDYEKDMVRPTTILKPFLTKRRTFGDEREIRAIHTPLLDSTFAPLAASAGRHIPVDLDCLIEKVHLSPEVPSWFQETITKFLTRHNLQKDVIRSTIYDKPDY